MIEAAKVFEIDVLLGIKYPEGGYQYEPDLAPKELAESANDQEWDAQLTEDQRRSVVHFDYEPRDQFLPFHQRSQRWSCLVAHRRCGKTVACVNELIARASYTQKKDARYAYIAPYYRQAKDVAWQYLKSFGTGVIKRIRESELRVELFNGAWITLYGADNVDALRGIYLDGVILDEFGDARPSLWGTVVLPTLADRKGWAVFIGTPKGKNHFYEINQRATKEDSWYDLVLKSSETGLLDAEELNELRAQMTEDQYEQEMECSFEAAVMGTFYASLISKLETEGRIAANACSYDNDFSVYVSSDLGFSDSCSWWFWQRRPDGWAVIDYYEEHSQPLAHYFDMLIGKGYKYETIWLPHDARAKTLQTGRSTIEQFLNPEYIDALKYEGVTFPVKIAPKLSKLDGIDAVRLILPKCAIDTINCYDGIEALRAYRRQYNEITKSFSHNPLHDWASNGADAFRYFALVSEEGMVKATAQKGDSFKATPLTLSQLFKENERPRRGFQSMRI